MKKYVPPNILALIRIGDAVILTVKQLLPYGAGNQRFDTNRTNKKSTVRTYLAQQAYGQDWHRPLRNAGAALLYMAGNCQEQAAVVYALLRERLDGQTMASFCVSSAYKHHFTTIGIPNNDPASNVVVVDPWPQNAQAVLLEDHFASDRPIVVLRSKTGGKQGKIQKARSKYNLTPNEVSTKIIMASFNTFAEAPYNHLYCTKNNQPIEYTDDLIIFD